MSLKTESIKKTEVKQKLPVCQFMPVLKWMKIVESIGSKPTPRHGHRAVAMKDLLIVLSGGDNRIIDELDVYNTTNNQWFIPQTSGDKPPGSAAYGLVVDNTRLLFFGGMLEDGAYSNELYELQTSQWQWTKLKPKPPLYHRSPCPRLGHSFTLIDNMVYLFGGLANASNDPKNNIPRYLNDLYILNISSPDTLAWDVPDISGNYPTPRESHSAVAYTNSKGKCKLIIYGGMNGNRLGDICTLDIDTMSWDSPIVLGPSPLPRSLHSAITVQNRMYVFGGWVPICDSKNNVPLIQKKWVCSNWFGCLNLEIMTWEELYMNMNEDNMPKARAGHCAAYIETKMYIWSGRSGYKTLCNNQVCYEDFWFIELDKPQKCSKPILSRAFANALEIKYDSLPTADAYILQILKYNLPTGTAVPTSSTMTTNYSSLPSSTSKLTKKNTDNEDCLGLFTNTKSDDTSAKPNDEIVILPQGSTIDRSSFKERELFNLVTAQAPGNIQINTIQSTYSKPSLLENSKVVSPAIPKNTTCISSPSPDMLSDSIMHLFPNTKSADFTTESNENIKILSQGNTVNSSCLIKDKLFIPVTVQETAIKKIKTFHDTNMTPSLPQNLKAEISGTFDSSVLLKTPSMLSDSTKHTIINTKSVNKSNDNINVFSHKPTINPLSSIEDQYIAPITGQKFKNKKIKTDQSIGFIPLLPQNFKGVNHFTLESRGLISPPSIDLLSEVAADSTTLKTSVVVSSKQEELPKPDINIISAPYKIVQTMRSIKNIYPVVTMVPQQQAVSITGPVLQTFVAETVPKTKTNVLRKIVVFPNLEGSRSNFVKFVKTSQSNKDNHNVQIRKMITTSTLNKPSILKSMNPITNQQSRPIKINTLMKTVPLKTVSSGLPLDGNRSSFVIKNVNTNILTSPQIKIITTGSHNNYIQSFSTTKAHITNHTSVSNSPIQMAMISSSSDTLPRSNPVTITMGGAGYRKIETSGKSNLITIGGKPVIIKKVSGQNNMALLTSNSGRHVHMSTTSTSISQTNSKVPSSVKVSTNLPTRTNESILTRLAEEAGIIDSNNTCTDIEESTDNLMKELDYYIQKEKANMTAAANVFTNLPTRTTESVLTQLAVEAGIVDLINTSPNNINESTDYTMEELENLILEEEVDCV